MTWSRESVIATLILTLRKRVGNGLISSDIVISIVISAWSQITLIPIWREWSTSRPIWTSSSKVNTLNFLFYGVNIRLIWTWSWYIINVIVFRSSPDLEWLSVIRLSNIIRTWPQIVSISISISVSASVLTELDIRVSVLNGTHIIFIMAWSWHVSHSLWTSFATHLEGSALPNAWLLVVVAWTWFVFHFWANHLLSLGHGYLVRGWGKLLNVVTGLIFTWAGTVIPVIVFGSLTDCEGFSIFAKFLFSITSISAWSWLIKLLLRDKITSIALTNLKRLRSLVLCQEVLSIISSRSWTIIPTLIISPLPKCILK